MKHQVFSPPSQCVLLKNLLEICDDKSVLRVRATERIRVASCVCFVVNAFYERGQVHGKGGSGTLKRAQMVPRVVYDVVRTLPYGDDTV